MKTPLFALLAAASILATFGCGKGSPQGNHLYGSFSTLQTLKPDDPVMMAGVQIGYVDSVELDPSRAKTPVTMLIKRSVIVKTDSTATIKRAASPGSSCIVLTGGSPSAPPAVEGTILITREEPSSEN